ncbi:SDR family NAD(P)-dependent oxidoreductase [Nocardioides sp. C4-1]|uniref:SDR family NAD(P)-dependent oxidoreductase n=1 Tax=Nocardioides sp. C4-1 TaxID=3151851 RepID=UPI0032636AAA
MGLTGKRVFVSGSTQGIGFAVARGCLAEGARVVVNGRSRHGVERAVARLLEAVPDGDVEGLAADLADAAQVASLLAALDAGGGVDVLVNNAGVFDVAPFESLDDDAWRRYLEVNLMGGVRLARHLLPAMVARGWGRVVFVGTESAVDVPGDMVAYGASKAAALALANGLAKLTRGTEVTVNTVLGGPTWSDGVASAVEAVAAAQGLDVADLRAGLVRETSLLGRFIEPGEVADLVVYLAGVRSSATNGAALRADGGVLTATT